MLGYIIEESGKWRPATTNGFYGEGYSNNPRRVENDGAQLAIHIMLFRRWEGEVEVSMRHDDTDEESEEENSDDSDDEWEDVDDSGEEIIPN